MLTGAASFNEKQVNFNSVFVEVKCHILKLSWSYIGFLEE